MLRLLKDRYFWAILATFLIFIAHTTPEDFLKVSWPRLDESLPITDAIIDLSFYLGIIALGALRFGVFGGFMVGIPAFFIVLFSHIEQLLQTDISAELVFSEIVGTAISLVIGTYSSYKKRAE